jgi:alpha-beta hydrolase superfamily lysophospholipase
VARGVERRGRVVVLHGVQSHAGWYHGLGRRLAARGFEAHFPDRRGSGANARDRGHARSAGRLLADVAELGRYLGGRDGAGAGPRVLAGISWGGKLVAAAGSRLDDAGGFDGLALLCPGLHPRVNVSGREKLGVAAALLTGRGKARHFPIPLADPALFTANPEAQAFLAADPLSLRTASARLLFASRVIDRWVAAAPARLKRPLLLVLAGRDRIVENDRTRGWFGAVSAPKTLIEYPDAEHTLEFEPDPGTYAGALVGWAEGLRSRG